MHTDASPPPLFTPSMLDTLLARWKSIPHPEASDPQPSPADRTGHARAIFRQTLERHLPHMTPADQALYARLVAAREVQAWRTHFFDCFDLMARTRGAAIAVLRLHDLHNLLRDPDPSTNRTHARKGMVAHA